MSLAFINKFCYIKTFYCQDMFDKAKKTIYCFLQKYTLLTKTVIHRLFYQDTLYCNNDTRLIYSAINLMYQCKNLWIFIISLSTCKSFNLQDHAMEIDKSVAQLFHGIPGEHGENVQFKIS